MIIATGRSNVHVGAIADRVVKACRDAGLRRAADRRHAALRLGAARRAATRSSTSSGPMSASSTISRRCGAPIVRARRRHASARAERRLRLAHRLRSARLKAGPERELFERYFKRLAALARVASASPASTARDRRKPRAPAGGATRRGGARDPRRRCPRARGWRCSTSAARRSTSEQWAAEIGSARDASRPGLCGRRSAARTGSIRRCAQRRDSIAQLRRDDLAAPAGPSDGRRAALSRADDSGRTSLSSRTERALLARLA